MEDIDIGIGDNEDNVGDKLSSKKYNVLEEFGR